MANEMELLGDQPTFGYVPDSRVYIHTRCNHGTIISGTNFYKLCMPASRVRTICSFCTNAYSLDEFYWEETGEYLSAYVDRLEYCLPDEYRSMRTKRNFLAMTLAIVGLVGGIMAANAKEAEGKNIAFAGFFGFLGGFALGYFLSIAIFPGKI